MKKLFYIFLMLVAFGCRHSSHPAPANFVCRLSGVKAIRDVGFILDSVQLDSISSSFVGESCIQNNHIYFIDEKFCYIYQFDLNGKLLHTYVGQGMAENELPIKTILLFSPLPAGGFAILGSSWDVFVYDSNFRKINDYGINWHYDVTKEAMLRNPDPAQSQLYSLIAMTGKIRSTDKALFLPIASQHPVFNPTNPEYFSKGRNLALMDLETGYVDKIYGGFSPIYSLRANTHTFPYQFLALGSQNTFEIAYPPDSLIYKSDRDFNMQERFGFAGRNMDTSYQHVTDLHKFSANYNQMKATKGFYTGLEYVGDRDLTFRSYQKGGQEKTDGLQIYKGDTLISDVDVPKGFRVDGYSDPYFYSNSFVNEDQGEIKLYRFQLAESLQMPRQQQ